MPANPARHVPSLQEVTRLGASQPSASPPCVLLTWSPTGRAGTLPLSGPCRPLVLPPQPAVPRLLCLYRWKIPGSCPEVAVRGLRCLVGTRPWTTSRVPACTAFRVKGQGSGSDSIQGSCHGILLLGILSVAWPFCLRNLAACQEPLTEVRTCLIPSREPSCRGTCCQVPLKQASTPTTVQLAACVTHHQGDKHRC